MGSAAAIAGLAIIAIGLSASPARAITLSVDGPSEALFSEKPTFTMSVAGVPDGVARDVSISDLDTGAGDGCYWVENTACTKHLAASWPTGDGGPVTKHYRFEASAIGETDQVVKTVTFRQPDWELSLDGPDEVNADQTIRLQVAVTPQVVSPYAVSVFDLDTDFGIGGCWTYVGACTSVPPNVPLSATPYVKHFRASMSVGNDELADAAHDVTVFPPNIGVSITVPGIVLPGDSYTVTVDSAVHYWLPWPIVVRDGQGNVVGSCRTDQTPCHFTVTAGAEGTAQSSSPR